jgi:hypothetical protein
VGLVVAVVLAAALVASGAQAQGVFDYVTFDGIDYIRWIDEPGRTLSREDLGAEFATVECAMVGDRQGCPYGMDAGAAYLPAGTPMYALKGYRTDFRLVAVASGRLLLYQAWRNARAKTGGQLFDIARRVRAIEVQRGDRTPATPGTPARIRDVRDADALVDMILSAALRAPSPHPHADRRYWITLWLADGTTLGRPYFADSGELLGGVALPPEFRRIVERYLTE